MLNTRTYLFVAAVIAVVAMASKSSALPITDGLVHYWKFDESGSAEAALDSVGGNHASLGGYQPGDSRWEAGKRGNAIRFSRESNYALTQAPIDFNQYTIAFWMKRLANTGINPRVITPLTGALVIIADEDGLGLGTGSVRSLIPPVLFEWEHYAVTLDVLTDEVAVYKNGMFVRSGSTPVDPAGSNFWIFGHNQDTRNQKGSLDGLLDDFRIYDRILEPDEIAELASIPEPTTIAIAALAIIAGSFATRRLGSIKRDQSKSVWHKI